MSVYKHEDCECSLALEQVNGSQALIIPSGARYRTQPFKYLAADDVGSHRSSSSLRNILAQFSWIRTTPRFWLIRGRTFAALIARESWISVQPLCCLFQHFPHTRCHLVGLGTFLRSPNRYCLRISPHARYPIGFDSSIVPKIPAKGSHGQALGMSRPSLSSELLKYSFDRVWSVHYGCRLSA